MLFSKFLRKIITSMVQKAKSETGGGVHI